MIAQGFKNSVLVCEFEKPVIEVGQNGYDIDTLVIDGVSHNVASPAVSPFVRAAKGLSDRRKVREELLFNDSTGLVARCYVWLQMPCMGGQMSASEALTAGQSLGSAYGASLRTWIDLGSPDFTDALAGTDADRPWLDWIPRGQGLTIRALILAAMLAAVNG